MIFYANDEQKNVAEAYVRQLNAARLFGKKIVTRVEPLKGFYPAEDFLQHYSDHHPNNPYVLENDLPKLAALKERFPELCK
jgi:peptide-methionine (S)-S-oxide reductase